MDCALQCEGAAGGKAFKNQSHLLESQQAPCIQLSLGVLSLWAFPASPQKPFQTQFPWGAWSSAQAVPQLSQIWAMLRRGAAGSAPLCFGQSLPPWEATLYSHAQNIFNSVLVNFVSINAFSNGANKDLVQTVSSVVSRL